MVGVTASPENGQPMLAVAKVDASNRNAVIGVAKEAVSAETVAFEDGSEYVDFAPTAGVIAPNSYLVIITDGLAPAVNVSSLALVANGEIGDKIALSTSGEMRTSQSARSMGLWWEKWLVQSMKKTAQFPCLSILIRRSTMMKRKLLLLCPSCPVHFCWDGGGTVVNQFCDAALCDGEWRHC